MTGFSKMMNLARKGKRPVEMGETYPVTDPWMLGWKKIEKREYGVRTAEGYNAVYSPYVPPYEDKQPSLFMEYGLPFWDIYGDEWSVFKRRVIGFSKIFDWITDIFEEDLDDLHERLSGDWYR